MERKILRGVRSVSKIIPEQCQDVIPEILYLHDKGYNESTFESIVIPESSTNEIVMLRLIGSASNFV